MNTSINTTDEIIKGKTTAKRSKLRNMTFISMMTAISIVLYFVAEIPIIPAVPHLKLDLSDIPAMLAAVVAGPVGGIAVELLKNLIHVMRTGTFGLGELANFVVGAALVVPFSLVYRRASEKKKQAEARTIIIGGILSGVSIVVAGLAINALIYPIFMRMIGNPIESTSVLVAYLGSTVIMNLVKAGVNFAAITALLAVFGKRKASISI